MSAADYPYFAPPPIGLAHRGGSLHPPNVGVENTLRAFTEAVSMGFHYLETDVHGEPDQVSERKDPLSSELILNRPSRILRAGMVLTIEPGIYVRPAPGVPEAFHHIGIRIEDDALVTDAGCELMTRGVPVEPDEIEALMRA